MSAQVLRGRAGRVLLVGTAQSSEHLLLRLQAAGYQCALAEGPEQLSQAADTLRPHAVLVSGSMPSADEALRRIRQSAQLRSLPVLGDLSADVGLRSLPFDDWIHARDDIEARVESALRARRLIERDEQYRERMEILLEISHAATSSLELEQILRIAVEKLGRAVDCDRCSVVLVEGTGPRSARVVATREVPNLTSMPLDLVKYPELRRAIETREPVHVADALHDPLMADVRHLIAPHAIKAILVQPLICQDNFLGAIFLRMTRAESAFGRDEREFAQAVAGTIANSIRNARLHAALKRKRDDLESAYVDRYRELTEANRRLKELNRVKDDIIAVCSHDLRAPLQVLLGHGRLLLDSGLSREQQNSGEAIVRQGKKILGLVESLLERGKGEQARLSIDPSLIDIAELCKEASGDLGILAQERQLVLRSETPASLMVLGDEVKLREVLQNLITNALQHASASVRVFSQRLARPDGEAAKVIVEDDGPGIPPDQLHVVFDRYRHGPGGTGLGLAICKDFIELHGGEIWAEAVPSGGCAFVFTLPLAQSKPLMRREFVAPSESEEQPRVLVVEDEPEIAAVLAEILRSRYRVEVARDGAEGLAKAKAMHPDLVVMDVFLPKLDGLDAAVALKSTPDTSDIPVILLSAHKGVAEKVRALNLGAVDYMHKPFQALELLSRTERALKLQRAERELERSLTLLRLGGSDPDTGMPDRSGFAGRLEQEMSRGRRYGRALTLGIVSAASFPGEHIRACARIIRSKLRTPDVVGHLGAGIFAVALPECSQAKAQVVLQRIATELQANCGVGFSIQVVDAAEPAVSAISLLDQLVPSTKQE